MIVCEWGWFVEIVSVLDLGLVMLCVGCFDLLLISCEVFMVG